VEGRRKALGLRVSEKGQHRINTSLRNGKTPRSLNRKKASQVRASQGLFEPKRLEENAVGKEARTIQPRQGRVPPEK